MFFAWAWQSLFSPSHPKKRKKTILRRLNRTGGNRTRAAEMLGISVRTLRNKINQYRGEGITIPG